MLRESTLQLQHLWVTLSSFLEWQLLGAAFRAVAWPRSPSSENHLSHPQELGPSSLIIWHAIELPAGLVEPRVKKRNQSLVKLKLLASLSQKFGRGVLEPGSVSWEPWDWEVMYSQGSGRAGRASLQRERWYRFTERILRTAAPQKGLFLSLLQFFIPDLSVPWLLFLPLFSK